MSYDNTNSFVLFKNDRKEKDNQPDYTGKITLEDGREMRLAAWIKVSQNGTKFFSGKLSDFKPQEQTAKPDFDDDIPF